MTGAGTDVDEAAAAITLATPRRVAVLIAAIGPGGP